MKAKEPVGNVRPIFMQNEDWKLLIVKMDVHIENRTSSPSSQKTNAGPGNPQWFIWTVKARIARLRKSHIVCVREPGQDPQNAPGAEV